VKRDTLKLVLIGGVDHGKSTLLGRLVDEARSSTHQTRESSSDLNWRTEIDSNYALYADSLTEEKEGLYTLDTTQVMMEIGDRQIILIDVPGHAELIKNMVTGASQAEAALLVVDASQGICPMTVRHLEVLRLLKISRCVVCVNKMEVVAYDAAKFDLLAASLKETLRAYSLQGVAIIPLSALTGENLFRRTEKLAWYPGPTLWEALCGLSQVKVVESERLRFMLQDHYRIGNDSIYVGRVESGEISRGQQLALYPGGQLCTVRSIEKFGEPSPKRAVAGDCVGLTLAVMGIPRVGQVLCPVEDSPLVGSSLSVTLMNLGADPLEAGAELQFQCASLEAVCRVDAIEPIRLPPEGNVSGRLLFSEIGEAVLSFDQPLAVERFQDVPSLGRFVLAKTDKTVAGGVIQGGAGGSEGRE
jgi:sulfate adenylyltransferase subunit 1